MTISAGLVTIRISSAGPDLELGPKLSASIPEHGSGWMKVNIQKFRRNHTRVRQLQVLSQIKLDTLRSTTTRSRNSRKLMMPVTKPRPDPNPQVQGLTLAPPAANIVTTSKTLATQPISTEGKTMTQTLSTNTTERLIAAHTAHTEGLSEALYGLVVALRASGWTLQSIATPLGVSREIVRKWQMAAMERDLPLVTVETAPNLVTKETIRREGVEARLVARDRREAAILEKHLPRLKELKPVAEALRGPSKFNPDGAAASAEYTLLIDKALRSGIRSRILADALGVKEITLNARLRRSQLRVTAPTEKIPAWAKTPQWQAELKAAGRVS